MSSSGSGQGASTGRPHVALSALFWGRPTTGSGQYLHRLVEAFAQQPEALKLTLIADRGASQRAAPPPGVGWAEAASPFDSRPNLAKVWFEQVAAPRVAQTLGADLLHVPYFGPPLRSRVPVVATVHDLIPMLLPAYRGNPMVRLYTALAARGARRARRILTDSDASRADVLRLLGGNPARVERVYLAADAAFRPQTEEAIAQARAQWGLPEPFALYLGGFDQRKNVPLLLKALKESEGRWPLVIAGKLPARDSAFAPDPRRVARELGVTARVRFLGWIEEADKPALLAAAALFVFPSEYEGFGLPVLEALACGTATLTTRVSSLPELAGNAAALVPPDDAAALRHEMARLMADPEARAALGQRGLSQAARFSWQACAAETLAAYHRSLA